MIIMKITLVILFILTLFFNSHSQQKTIVGAIRWDAWLGKSDAIGKQLNTSLSPHHWHYRLPFYTTIIDSLTLDINANSQKIADREIEYAAHAGLNYFAFLMYDDTIALSDGVHKYLASSKKKHINFCIILNDITTENTATSVSRILNYTKSQQYQRVLGNRPLVYAFNLKNSPQLPLALKAACAANNLPEPYIVSMQNVDIMPTNTVFDAITRYWYDGDQFGGLATGAPYITLMKNAQANWQLRKVNGAKQIPLVSLGTDGRPRIEHPVSWITNPAFYQKYFTTPTVKEIVAHVGQAIDFVEKSPTSCEAKTILLYAWNENDEGGWLTPTRENNHTINTSRIDSLHSFFLKYNKTNKLKPNKSSH